MMFNKSIKDILRHKLSSLLIINALGIFVFLSLIFFSLLINLQTLKESLSTNARITVFPEESADIKNLMERITSIGGVINISHIDSDSTLEIIKKRFPDNDILFSNAVMPELIEIKAHVNRVDSIKKSLLEMNDVYDIILNISSLNSAIEMINLVKYSVIMLLSILFFLCVILVYYTTRLGAVQRKWEITIYRLCGATEWFIKLPYLVSGILLGILGAAFGIIMYYVLGSIINAIFVHFAEQWINSYKLGILPVFALFAIVIVSVFISMVGNYFAFTNIDKME